VYSVHDFDDGYTKSEIAKIKQAFKGLEKARYSPSVKAYTNRLFAKLKN
jgi:hypothetical protein